MLFPSFSDGNPSIFPQQKPSTVATPSPHVSLDSLNNSFSPHSHYHSLSFSQIPFYSLYCNFKLRPPPPVPSIRDFMVLISTSASLFVSRVCHRGKLSTSLAASLILQV